MKHLILDTEQEAIVRQSLAGATAFLTARVLRRDPAGMLSKALALQERKVANMQFQLDQPPLAGWLDLIEANKPAFETMVLAFSKATTEHQKAVLYTQIHAFISANRKAEPDFKTGNHKISGDAAP